MDDLITYHIPESVRIYVHAVSCTKWMPLLNAVYFECCLDGLDSGDLCSFMFMHVRMTYARMAHVKDLPAVLAWSSG